MDPNACRAEIRRLTALKTRDESQRERLRELRDALREWQQRGGFAPR